MSRRLRPTCSGEVDSRPTCASAGLTSCSDHPHGVPWVSFQAPACAAVAASRSPDTPTSAEAACIASPLRMRQAGNQRRCPLPLSMEPPVSAHKLSPLGRGTEGNLNRPLLTALTYHISCHGPCAAEFRLCRAVHLGLWARVLHRASVGGRDRIEQASRQAPTAAASCAQRPRRRSRRPPPPPLPPSPTAAPARRPS